MEVKGKRAAGMPPRPVRPRLRRRRWARADALDKAVGWPWGDVGFLKFHPIWLTPDRLPFIDFLPFQKRSTAEVAFHLLAQQCPAPPLSLSVPSHSSQTRNSLPTFGLPVKGTAHFAAAIFIELVVALS